MSRSARLVSASTTRRRLNPIEVCWVTVAEHSDLPSAQSSRVPSSLFKRHPTGHQSPTAASTQTISQVAPDTRSRTASPDMAGLALRIHPTTQGDCATRVCSPGAPPNPLPLPPAHGRSWSSWAPRRPDVDYGRIQLANQLGRPSSGAGTGPTTLATLHTQHLRQFTPESCSSDQSGRGRSGHPLVRAAPARRCRSGDSNVHSPTDLCCWMPRKVIGTGRRTVTTDWHCASGLPQPAERSISPRAERRAPNRRPARGDLAGHRRTRAGLGRPRAGPAPAPSP